jgi:hypothetical protein
MPGEPTGSFATDQDPPAQAHRFADRVFVGAGSQITGDWPANAITTGLTPTAQTLHSWLAREATMWVDATQGKYGVVGHSQSSLQTNPPHNITTGSIGVAGSAIGDGAPGVGSWGGYFEAFQITEGFTVGAEFAVANLTGTVGTRMNPFNVKNVGVVDGVAVWLQAGCGLDAINYNGSLGEAADVSNAITIASSYADNSVKFRTGVVIADGAIDGQGVQVHRAIDMPERHQIGWWRSENGPGAMSAYIWSDRFPAGSAAVGITFKQNLIDLAASLGISVSAVRVGSNKVVGARNTGWTTAAGTANKNASGINVNTITATDANLREVAAWVKAIHDALASHGLIGP